MTVSEQIMHAVSELVTQDNKTTFTDADLRDKVKVEQERWDAAYAPVLLGMKTERAASAPDSGARYRNVFQQLRADTYTLTAYGKELLEKMRRAPRSSETLELNKVEDPEKMDGLRAWQAATVRLWSANEDAFAELSLTWLPANTEGAPWMARLHCGDKGEPGWVEDVQIVSAASVQQALQRLWDRAKVRHGLFKDTPEINVKLPTDFPADLWLTAGERALLERTINAVKRAHAGTAIRLSYHPDRRLSARWTALLHATDAEPPEGVMYEVSAASLLYAADALLKAMDSAAREQIEPMVTEAKPSLDPEMRALTHRTTDVAIQAVKPPKDSETKDE